MPDTININRKEIEFGAYPSPPDDRDFLASAIDPEKLPEELDLTPGMFEVRDQGMQPTCVAMVGAQMKDWQEKKDIEEQSEPMSAQFIYNHREHQERRGMCGRDLMRILKDIGSVPESMYRYQTKDPITSELLEEAKRFKIAGYAAVYTVEEMKLSLLKNGPCYISVPVYPNAYPSMWKQVNPEDYARSGHAMTVVGYTKEGFVLRNSWGYWNYDGECIFPFEDWNCLAEAYTTIDADTVKKIIEIKEEKKKYNLTNFQKFLRRLILILTGGIYELYQPKIKTIKLK